MNAQLFKSIVALNGNTLTEVAELLGISRATLSLRVNNKKEWNVPDIKKLKKIYSLNAQQIDDIFLN